MWESQNKCEFCFFFTPDSSGELTRRMAEKVTQVISESTSGRGGKRPGAGRKKRVDRGNDVHIRISEAQHFRWVELKNLKKLPNDNAVANYLLDLAADFDEQAEGSAQ